MRLGGYLPGIPPASHFGFADWWEGFDFQLDWARRLGWRCFSPAGGLGAELPQQKEAIARMAARDLLYPGPGHYGARLAHPDPAVRAGEVAKVVQLVEWAAALGLESVQVVAHNEDPQATIRHMYTPYYKSEATWAPFVASCQEICAACRGTGVRLALEPWHAGPLDSAASLRRALDQVDRPEIAINLDLTNMIPYERYFDINALIDEVIEAVGPAIVMAHLKDLKYQPNLQLRIDEVPIGEGNVDYVHFMRRLHGLGRDIPAFIEHATELNQMMSSWGHVRKAAQEAGAI